MQAVASGQAAIGVAVSGIQLLSALASANASASRTTATEEGAEARTAFEYFALSMVFYIFSAWAYVWLMRTPEYQEIKGSYLSRRFSISMSQSFTADDDGVALASEQPRSTASSPVARAISMIKTNLPFNFAVAWTFLVTQVSGGKSCGARRGLTHIVVRIPTDYSVDTTDGPYN